MSKILKHQTVKVRNSTTGEFESILTIKGESAYEAAIRLGTFTGTEEEYNNQLQNQRDDALNQINTTKTESISAVALEGTKQIGNIVSEGEKQTQNVINKGTETLASIPETYTELQKQCNTKIDLQQYIENYYALRRTGKVYQTKIWKFATNQSSAGEKLLDNASLVFEPSTDTVEGQDDYLNGKHPMFEWVNVNYKRNSKGAPYPVAIEGTEGYKVDGSIDVGTMQMSFYGKWDTSNAEYDLVTISDSPHPELGLEPWSECNDGVGGVLPWCIGSKYFSGKGSDGLLRSFPNSKPELYQSHNNIITNYQKKGEGYWGAGCEANLFQIIFNVIKGATKNSQSLYRGCTSYSYQYPASIERSTNETYFPVTTAQAANLIVGSSVYVGYGSNNNGELNIDRGVGTMRSYADLARITKIEPIDDSNSAVYLDIETGFNTTPVALTDTLSSPIYLSTMEWYSGSTDKVIGRHDGSYLSNTSGKCPYRVQGREYAIGAFFVASDTVMDFQSDYSKNVYVAPRGLAHSSSDSTIRSTYTLVGNIPANGNGSDFYIGDISVNFRLGVEYPSVVGSSDFTGWGDYCWAGGANTSGTRGYLIGGALWDSFQAGSVYLRCSYWLDRAFWLFCARD